MMLSTSKLLVRCCGSSFTKCTSSTIVSRSSSSTGKLYKAQTLAQSTTATPADSEKLEQSVVEVDSTGEHGISTQEQQSTQVKSTIASHSRRIAEKELEDTFTPFRYVYPEFLPDPNAKYRNRIREKLERIDMLNHRSHIDIPEFYVGSILNVVVSDQNAPGKTNTFVGICIQRDYTGLRSTFTLRNVIDGLGVEICYDLYNPTIQSITCLRLEKRLDENLRYLRDAPPEYSTFPMDMAPELRNPEAPVPINPLKVKLKSKPWSAKWHLWDLKGIEEITDQLEEWQLKKWKTWKFGTGYDVKDYDLMKIYRSTIPIEEQTEIFSEFGPQLTKLSQSMKKQKRKRVFVKPQKTA